MDKISENNYFITRLNKSYKIDLLSERHLSEEIKNLKLIKEIKGKLYKSNGEKTKTEYRIIHGAAKVPNWDKKKETKLNVKKTRKIHKNKTKVEIKHEMLEEQIIFVTNIPEDYLSSKEIAEIYIKRWEIEIFFKLIKQELHFSHLINRSENGIRVMLYVTMLFVL